MESSMPYEFAQNPSLAPSWGEGQHLADTQPRVQVVQLSYSQSPVNRAYYPPFPDHSHQATYCEPNPASISSPTNSSPTGSPYSWDQTRRVSMTAAHPLLLAQHPQVIQHNLSPPSIHSPVSPYTLVHQPPPTLSTSFPGDYTQQPPLVASSPMTYSSPVHTSYVYHPSAPPHYAFAPVRVGDGVGVHRPQLPTLTTALTYQVLQPPTGEYGYGYTHSGSYKMNVEGRDTDDGMAYEMDEAAPSLGHFTPTDQQPGSATSSSSVNSVSSHYGLVNGQPARRPVQTQLLLANAMPSSSVIPTGTDGNISTGRSVADGTHQSGVQETFSSGVSTEPTVAGSDHTVGPLPPQGTNHREEKNNVRRRSTPTAVRATIAPLAFTSSDPSKEMSVGQSKVEHERSSCIREESVVRDPTGSGAQDDAVQCGPDGSNELRDRGQRSSNVDTTKLNIVGRSCADHAGTGSDDNVETGRERFGSQPHGCATPSLVPFHQVTEPVKVLTDHRDGTTSPERAAGEEEDNERHNAVVVAAAASHVKSNASNNAGRYDVSVNDSRAIVRNAVQGAVKTHIGTGRMVGLNREGEFIHNTEVNTDPTSSSTTVSANGSGGRVHPRIDIDHSYSVPLHPTHSLDSPMTNSEMQVVASPSHFRSHAESPYEYSYPYARRLERHPDDLESHTPVLYKQEWRGDSYSDHAMTPLSRPVDRSTVPHGPPLSPVSTYGMIHRPSLPDLSAAPEPDPTVTGGFVPQGGRLVPAAFFAGDSSRGSGSSAASTPPNGIQEPRYSPSSHNIIAPSPHYPVQPLDATQLDDEPPYEPSYTPFPPNMGPTSAMRPYEGESVYYQAYGSEVAYTPVHSHYDLHARGSTSPVPSISGSKRMRVADWDDSRELQRRRLSYSQSISVAPGIQQYRPPLSPTLSTTSGVGLSRLGGEIAPPSLREMGIRDAIGESLHRTPGAINGLPELDDFTRDRSRADTSYSFIALPGNTVRKRPRRKFEEITRNYACNWPDCAKAYGTLNHLNAHVIMQKHGPKRTPAEFKELRKLWRKQKRDQQSQHQPPRSVQYQQDANDVFNDAETIHLDDDDASPYNGSV